MKDALKSIKLLKRAMKAIRDRKLVCVCGHAEEYHYRGANVELLHESDCTADDDTCECKKFERAYPA